MLDAPPLTTIVTLELFLLALSVFFLFLSLSVSYINYRSSMIGDRYTRERILRERFDNMESEKELWDTNRIIQITEPRIYNGSLRDWVKSLFPRGSYPGYTTFTLGFIYDDYPKLVLMGASEVEVLNEFFEDDTTVIPEEKANLSYNKPPSPSEFEQKEKLKEAGLKRVKEIRSPIGYDKLEEKEDDDDGAPVVEVNPATGYQLYFDTTDPDDIESVIGGLHLIIREIELDEERIVFPELPGSLSELDE
jgi:hypothetical protein